MYASVCKIVYERVREKECLNICVGKSVYKCILEKVWKCV